MVQGLGLWVYELDPEPQTIQNPDTIPQTRASSDQDPGTPDAPMLGHGLGFRAVGGDGIQGLGAASYSVSKSASVGI